MKILALFIVTILITACTSTPAVETPCQEGDWYEIGRRDGANGRPLSLEHKYPGFCDNSNVEKNRALYENGRNAGLIEYCKPENAFEMGRSGLPYYGVCPKPVEDKFLSNYHNGKKYRGLQKDNAQINEQMDSIFNQLKLPNLSVDQKSKLQSTLEQLRLRHNQNASKSKSLENKIEIAL